MIEYIRAAKGTTRLQKTLSNINLLILSEIFILFSIFLAGQPGFSQTIRENDSTLTRQSTVVDSSLSDTLRMTPADTLPIYDINRVVPNRAFRVGEKLTFNIRYGIFKAGEATMEVREIALVNDSIPAYHIVTTARSARFFDVFYKVRDEVETYLDARGLFSWKFNKRLREAGYKFDLFVKYDPLHRKANVHRIRYHKKTPLKIRKESKFTLDVPAYVLDVLGAFYYVRTQRLKVGEPIYMANHDNKKVFELKVIIQRREQIKVPAGKFKCIVVKPVLEGESIFKQKGELWIWLTDDEHKIPVKMKSKVAVGSITTELKKIEGVEMPIRARVD